MEQKPEITSNQYSLNFKDFLRGLLIAMGTAALTVAQQSIDAGAFTLNWKVMMWAGLGGGITYLLKNYFQPAQIKQTVTNAQATSIKNSGADTDTASK